MMQPMSIIMKRRDGPGLHKVEALAGPDVNSYDDFTS